MKYNKEEIYNTLNEMNIETGYALLNEHTKSCDHYNSMLYSMDDFDNFWDESVRARGALWLCQRVYFGNFNPNHDFFAFNGYGNLISFNGYDKLEVAYCDIQAIADWIIDNDREDLVVEYELQEMRDEDEEAIADALANDRDIVKLWNERCDDLGEQDDRIMAMYELNEYFPTDNLSVTDILARLCNDFDPVAHDWFCETIYGLCSFETPTAPHSPYDEKEMIEWLKSHRDRL